MPDPGLVRDARLDSPALGEGLLHALAHDLRNPLAPLSNGIELLRLAGDDGAARERALALMERQLRQLGRLADLISKLAPLAVAPMRAPSLEGPSRVHAALQSVAALAGPRLAALQLRLTLPASGPPSSGSTEPAGSAWAQGLELVLDELMQRALPGDELELAWQHDAGSPVLCLSGDPDALRGPGRSSIALPHLSIGLCLAQRLFQLQGAALEIGRASASGRLVLRLGWPGMPPAS